MSKVKFSASNREAIKDRLKNEEFDLLVIGGGMTGAGIALDAITRGLKVALVEKKDFASGTSSRSTKLIHGGLRYLKQLEVGLVKEVGRERAILYKNAPHLVIPEKMLLPIVEGGTLGKYSTSLALYVYDRLAGVEKKERRYMIEKKKTMKAEPLLRDDILLGGGVYIEYRSDDARLVIDVMKSAVERGALALNYSHVNKLNYNKKGKINGCTIKDELDKKEYVINAKHVINAAGPWVDTLREEDGSLDKRRLHLTKGVHIVVPKDKFPLNTSVYFDNFKDKRMLFVIPRGEVVYMGTTDTNYHDSIDSPNTSKADADYILEAVNYMFPTVKLQIKDCISSWAGLRPLIHEQGKDPSELSRKDEIFISESGLISIAGGKLTGFRKMAERSVDEVMKKIAGKEGKKIKKSVTEKIVISGGDFDGNKAVKKYIDKLDQAYDYIPKNKIKDLVYRFGTNSESILKKGKENSKDLKGLLLAELDYCMKYEMTCTLSDFLIRRTGRLYFNRPEIADTYNYLQKKMAKDLNYSEEENERLLQEFEDEYNAVVAFKR